MAEGITHQMSKTRRMVCVALLVALGLSLGTSEFVVIGIESDLVRDLHVSLSQVGQLISLFSLPYALLTPILALTTGRFKRYQLLVAYSLLFILANVVSAVAQSFEVLLVGRILLGAVSGALLAVAVTFIAELVSPKRVSAVLAVVYASYSVAMVFVTSVGKIVADLSNWHFMMYGTLLLSIIVCAAALALLPRTGSTDEPATFGEQIGLLGEPAVIWGMLVFLFGVGAVYTFYGYVTPYLEEVLGMGTYEISIILMLYGVAALVSNLLGGWIEARFGLRALVVTYLMQAVALAGIFFAASNATIALPLVICVGLLMYLASVSCVELFMRTARRRHPKALTLASSLEPMSFNCGIAFGTAMGGAVVAQFGIQYVGMVGATLSIVAIAAVLACDHYARKAAAPRRESAAEKH